MRLLQTTGLKFSDAAAGPLTYAFPANLTPGSVVIGALTHFVASVNRISAVTVGSGTAAKDADVTDTGLNNHHEIWRGIVTTAGLNVVITVPTGSNYVSSSWEEWRGILHTSPLDQTGTTGQTTSATPTVTAAGATAQADEVAYAGFTDYVGANWTSATPPSGGVETFEQPDGTTHEAGAAAYKELTTIQTPSMVFGTGASMSHIGALATYKWFRGRHHLKIDFLNAGGSSITTPAVDTQATQSSFLVFVGRGILADFPSTPTDNKSNTFSIVGSSHAYTNWPTSGTALFKCLNGAGGSGHTFTTAKPNVNDEVSIIAVEVPGGYTVLQDNSWTEDLTSPNTSASVTTTGAAWLVAFWSGDDANGELNPNPDANGWYKLEWSSSLASNHVQVAAFARFVSGAGTYTIDVTGSTAQGAQLHLVALQAGGSGTPATRIRFLGHWGRSRTRYAI